MVPENLDIKVAADIAEIKTDIKYIREAMIIAHQEAVKRHDRITSLETSRTWARAWAAALWSAIFFLSWDWIRTLFKHLP